MLTALALFCPPLAVLLTAPTSQVVKNIGLTLLLVVPGVWHALTQVEQYRVRRRYDTLLRILDAQGTPASGTRSVSAPQAA